MTTLYVNKASGTFADTLLALGVADLMRLGLARLGRLKQSAEIYDAGQSFLIQLPPVEESDLASSNRLPLLRPLSTAKQQERQAKKGRTFSEVEIFDYEAEQEKQRQLQAQLAKLPPEQRSPKARLDPELEHYKAINVMKVADTFNELVLRWENLSAEQQWFAMRLLFRLFSEPFNDVEQAQRTWEKWAKEQGLSGKTQATAVQLLNPTSGKGANAPKSNRLAVGGLESFWLLELVKFRGFMLGAAPYMLSGSKDRKTFVVLPERVELETLRTIMQKFRESCWSSTAIKQDILAALRLAQVLVNHRRNELASSQNLDPDELPPLVSITHGLDVAFYKDMGSAHAVMNVSTINLPSWLPPRPRPVAEATQIDELLKEHIAIINRIEGPQRKEGSEELELLRIYRDFLSSHDLRLFWRFAASYGPYLFRQREREKNEKRWLKQFASQGLDKLVLLESAAMETKKGTQDLKLTPILQNKGFQRIASAIREATVNAQRRRFQDSNYPYEVRYGLGQELLRKIHRRDEFMQALSEFLLHYNAETAREEEKVAQKLGRALRSEHYSQHHLRYPVTTSDIDEFTTLFDQYPCELVASMLLSYGYARWGKAAESSQSEEDTEAAAAQSAQV
ncbi:MAG: hypothetical protein IMW90_06835 [Thermogemmatispora sp.]|uniref:hypothetical protein n=1 Tax=Thermogemmatispora sp. TaxID=1968838 RepID=UPI0019EB5018|nr:hypothetical protein [Thermogemmatispora sp.]MBE3565430.1 hypothetical protein [Thermogemmatispora sp.]